jgi:histone acetyltransferase (RNA polymerase elongator complex component)
MIVPIFLPHLGCQHRCIYCDQDIITDIREEDLRTRIDQTLAKRTGSFEVGLYGGNIFGLKPEAVKRLFSYFDSYTSVITNFRISTKPVPLDYEVITILKENRVTTIELGIPTFNDQILQFLNRRHTAADLKNTFNVLTREKFQVALQVMIGLPHETMEDIGETITNIINLKPAYLRIYPLTFIRGTSLADMYKAEEFSTITLEGAIHRAMLIYLNALQHGIKTVKMGLTDNEVIKDRIVGGYYHPAFGFLVKSQAFYLAVTKKIKEGAIKGNVLISLNNRDISHLLGHKRCNISRFQELGISTITWQINDIPPGTFKLASGSKELLGNVFDAIAMGWDDKMNASRYY